MNTYVKPSHEVVQEFGRPCLKHPANVETTSWHRVTVALITSGQRGPYQDSVYQADVCFEGGHRVGLVEDGGPTTKAGIDGPFFTKPPEARVREFACWLTGAKESPSAYGTQLTECRCIEEAETYTIWRITAITPYCD